MFRRVPTNVILYMFSFAILTTLLFFPIIIRRTRLTEIEFVMKPNRNGYIWSHNTRNICERIRRIVRCAVRVENMKLLFKLKTS